jgi:hypothetical protein
MPPQLPPIQCALHVREPPELLTLKRAKARARAPERAGESGGASPLLCGEEPCGIEP